MSFQAVWNVYDPAELPEVAELVVRTPEDVDHLVTLLSEPSAEQALISHSARRPTTSEFTGRTVPDHLLQALVRGGFGYLLHYCPEHPSSASVGDPTSPAHHYDYTDFEAGTGLPLPLFTNALKEFLTTASRPTCVGWRAVD
ncbi:Imm1 family immunity protein [Actinosynnema sp. NPDC020468]|uniref:Imm1 family immunity protein n=1 Tax=Actinosynnema sp. NPDC020468 TaxID=3154488 RepID=UPI0033E32944